MKELILKAGGQEITVYAEESELAKLTKPERARTGYERVADEKCYYARGGNICIVKCECDNDRDNINFTRGDYVNDEKLYNDRERARVLHDRLEQWQALNDEPVDWSKTTKTKYKIIFNYSINDFRIFTSHDFREINIVYFSSKEKAEEAIEVFRDELMWYYTKYRSRLDEKRTEAAT